MEVSLSDKEIFTQETALGLSVQLRLAQFFWANLYKCCESGARPTRASAFI